MRFKLLSSIIASASLVAAPAVGQSSAPAASKLSVARAASPVQGEQLAEGSGGIIALALVAGIVAIAVLAAIEESDDDDDSVSA